LQQSVWTDGLSPIGTCCLLHGRLARAPVKIAISWIGGDRWVVAKPERWSMTNSDPDNVPGETVQGMSVPENESEAQAAQDNSDETGQEGHAESIAQAEESALSLEEKYSLGKKD
jgi:hypothetical protein